MDTTEHSIESAEVGIVQRARDGDNDAFAELVRLYQRRVVSVAYRLLGNVEDARDVSQEVFVRAYKSLGQLEDPSRFGPWLIRVTSNAALNFRRARSTRAAASLDNLIVSPAEVRKPDTGQPMTTGQEDGDGPLPEELRQAINQAMERLPDKQRLSLILFSVEGMPQKEVAEVLDCSVELVKWNVFTARKKLKEMLQEFV